MFECKETSPTSDLKHGHVVVGTVPTPLTTSDAKFNRGILVRAPGAGDLTPNTDTVFIGHRGVKASYAASSGGLPLPPGAAIEIPVEEASQLYVVSLTEGQDLAWMGV